MPSGSGEERSSSRARGMRRSPSGSSIGERILGVGRAWFMKRLLASKEVQAEALPAFIPGGVRGALAPSAGMAVRFLAKKYAVPDDVEARIEHTVRPLLHDVRAALSKGVHILSPATFSVADIVMASALHVVRPHESMKLGPFTREAWTQRSACPGLRRICSSGATPISTSTAETPLGRSRVVRVLRRAIRRRWANARRARR